MNRIYEPKRPKNWDEMTRFEQESWIGALIRDSFIACEKAIEDLDKRVAELEKN